MTTISRGSKKEALWAELERQRNRAAVLEREVERLRAEQARLMERTRLTEELAERVRTAHERLEILTSLTKELASFDQDGVLDLSVQRIPFLVGARVASVYLYEPAARRLVLKQHTHGREIAPTVDLDAAPSSLMALAVEGRRALCIDDVGRFHPAGGDPVRLPNREHYDTPSCIVAPLIAGGEVQGVLNLADRFDRRPFDPAEHLGVIRQACDLLAVSLRNAHLFEEVQRSARTCSLTGLLNQQAFAETLETEVRRATRYHNPLALLACRLKGVRFASANYGLQAGDAVVKQAARLIRRSVRDVDIVGRFAPDEFGIILPEQEVAGALVVARRLAGVLGAHRFQVGAATLSLATTLGVAAFGKQGGGAELLALALDSVRRGEEAGEPIGPTA